MPTTSANGAPLDRDVVALDRDLHLLALRVTRRARLHLSGRTLEQDAVQPHVVSGDLDVTEHPRPRRAGRAGNDYGRTGASTRLYVRGRPSRAVGAGKKQEPVPRAQPRHAAAKRPPRPLAGARPPVRAGRTHVPGSPRDGRGIRRSVRVARPGASGDAHCDGDGSHKTPSAGGRQLGVEGLVAGVAVASRAPSARM